MFLWATVLNGQMFYGSHDAGMGLQYHRILFQFQQLHLTDQNEETNLHFNIMDLQRLLKHFVSHKLQLVKGRV